MALKKHDRVQVIESMRSRFWDIGAKAGTVIEMDGFAICEFPGIAERMRIKPEYLEVISHE